MSPRLRALATPLALAWVISIWAVSSALAAAPFTLVSAATYRIAPEAGTVSVNVSLTFRNTTPDPPGSRSLYRSIPLALQPGASAVTARDAVGTLKVSVAKRSTSTVANVLLRAALRYGQQVRLSLTYRLTDGANPQLRIRPSAVVLPIWSFGTSGSVVVRLPTGMDVKVAGSAMTSQVSGAETVLTSGKIANPPRWQALLTAAGVVQYTSTTRSVALAGGTLELRVRAWQDDPGWRKRIIDLAARALPSLQRQIGLPYSGGQLVLTESLPAGIGTLAEPVTGAQEVAVAFDAPPFTVLHQLAHVWIGNGLAKARWIREGLSSHEAAVVASELKIPTPYDPATEAKARAAAAIPLDAWDAVSGAGAAPASRADIDAWAYAAAWAQVDRLAVALGEDGLRQVLGRAAAGTSPYDPASSEAAVAPSEAVEPLDSRSFLDQLESVSGKPLGVGFTHAVFGASDAPLLAERAAARSAFQSLVDRAKGWGAPRPIVEALTAWQFDNARVELDRADRWVRSCQQLQTDVRRLGLSLPDRLAARWRDDGGGAQASAELDAERALVAAYADARTRLGGLNPVEWLGVLGGPQPREQLATGAGLFAAGDLHGALDAIERATSLDAGAQAAGVVRLAVGAAVLSVIAAGVAISIYRIRRLFSRRRRLQARTPV